MDIHVTERVVCDATRMHTNGSRMSNEFFMGNWGSLTGICVWFLTKTQTTLLESFGTTCFVLPLSGIWSEVYFHHLPANAKTYSHEYQNFQEAKTLKIMHSLFFSVSVVFAFADSRAWNATVDVDGEWRKLVYSQTPSIPNDKSWKDWNQQKGYSCFCETETQEFTSEPKTIRKTKNCDAIL